MKKTITLVALTAILLGSSSITYAKNNYNVNRIYGDNRYKTSINISKSFNDTKVDNVILASGNNFPDALAGSTLSKKLNAPILLVDKEIKDSMDAVGYIRDHLSTGGTIYILGGNASINENYTSALKGLGYKNIVRLGGSNRFDTNKVIVNSMNIEKGTPVVITNGYGFADALSVSSVAASKGYPILMSGDKKLPEEIKAKIKDIQPSQVYLIGGQGAVSDNIMSEIKSIVPSLDSSNITRIGGKSRYDTSLEICKYFNLQSETAVIANGENFPDALSGSTLASKENSPIILTDGKAVSTQKKYLDNTTYKNLIVLGGTGAVSQMSESILNGSISALDIIKSNSVYSFNMKDNKEENYSVHVYSDDKKLKTAKFDPDEDWNGVWAGAGEGDKLTRGHYKIAVAKQGETEPEIYDAYDNELITLNLDRKLVKVHKNTQQNQPDFLMMGTPQASNVSEMKVYYIKDGKLKSANFEDEKETCNEVYTFNSSSLFFNQAESGVFETSSYDNSQSFGFYIHSWNFNLESGRFTFLGNRFMDRNSYFNYAQKTE